jgi:hypothetical protein
MTAFDGSQDAVSAVPRCRAARRSHIAVARKSNQRREQRGSQQEPEWILHDSLLNLDWAGPY